MPSPLLPIQAYTGDPTGLWARARWVTGLVFGLGMGLFWLLSTAGRTPIENAIWSALLTGVVMGILFGLAMPALARWMARGLVERLLRLDPSYITAPPPTSYSTYLPSSLYSKGIAYGGVLFIGPGGMSFHTHKRFQPKDLKSITIPAHGAQVAASSLRLSGWSRLLLKRPPETLRVTWADNEAIFLVPDATTVAGTAKVIMASDAA